MSFKGQFNWIQSMRQGGRKAISFTLTCTNLFKSETFDAAIIDSTGQQQPMLFSQLSLGAKSLFVLIWTQLVGIGVKVILLPFWTKWTNGQR